MTFSRVLAGLHRGDRRRWLAVLAVVIAAAAAAITAIMTSGAPAPGEPVHAMRTPARIGSFTRADGLDSATHLAGLRTAVIQMSAGQASNVTSAVYESGNPSAGTAVQIIMFIGGHLTGAAPVTSITGFTREFAGATAVSAGPLGGTAACAQQGVGTAEPASLCVWFDNDSFGEIVSPTMNATTLATVMRTIRPHLEIVVKD